MKFKKLAIASAIALASTGSFAAYGDVFFADSFSATFSSMGAGSIAWDAGSLAEGKYNFEASVTTTVPERETYALMLAIPGVMGFIAMRRKAG